MLHSFGVGKRIVTRFTALHNEHFYYSRNISSTENKLQTYDLYKRQHSEGGTERARQRERESEWVKEERETAIYLVHLFSYLYIINIVYEFTSCAFVVCFYLLNAQMVNYTVHN